MQTEPMSKPKVVSKDKENTDNSITSSNTLTSTQTTSETNSQRTTSEGIDNPQYTEITDDKSTNNNQVESTFNVVHKYRYYSEYTDHSTSYIYQVVQVNSIVTRTVGNPSIIKSG